MWNAGNVDALLGVSHCTQYEHSKLSYADEHQSIQVLVLVKV